MCFRTPHYHVSTRCPIPATTVCAAHSSIQHSPLQVEAESSDEEEIGDSYETKDICSSFKKHGLNDSFKNVATLETDIM